MTQPYQFSGRKAAMIVGGFIAVLALIGMLLYMAF